MAEAGVITWLYETRLATLVRDVPWVVPFVQSIHIVAIAVLIGAALVSHLRIAGVIAHDVTLASVADRYLRLMRRALVALLVSGAIMVTGEPDRVLINSTFWLKMGLILAASLASWIVFSPLTSEKHDHPSALVKTTAWLCLGVWTCVIFAGRWIGYT